MNNFNGASLKVFCQYCKSESKLVGGDVIYPRRPDLNANKFYHCRPCAAWVGCHPGTERPLGVLANSELRQWKQRAHAAFDPIWKNARGMTRKEAYAWLADKLGIHRERAHIGEFDVETCKRVVELCKAIEAQNEVRRTGERPATSRE